MKMLNKGLVHIILALAWSCLIPACEEPVTLSYDHIPKRIAVYSSLSTEIPFEVTLTSTVTPTDPIEAGILDEIEARIIVNQQQVLDLLPVNTNGLYRPALNFYPSSGDEISLFAKSPGLEAIEAVTIIPDSSRLTDLEITHCQPIPSNEDCTTDANFDMFMRVIHGQNRYYHIVFYQTTETSTGDPENPGVNINYYRMQPLNPLDAGMMYHHESGVLVDSEMVGRLSPLEFSFSILYFICEGQQSIETPGPIVIEVRAVTGDYYLYHNTLSRQLQSRKDPFAEPIQIYTNIVNGLGVFSAYNSLFYSIELPCL